MIGAGGAHGGFLLFYDLEQNKIVHDVDAKMHVHEIALHESSDTIYGVGTIVGGGFYALIGEVAGEAGMLTPIAFLTAAVIAMFSAFSNSLISRWYIASRQ